MNKYIHSYITDLYSQATVSFKDFDSYYPNRIQRSLLRKHHTQHIRILELQIKIHPMSKKKKKIKSQKDEKLIREQENSNTIM